jgi:DNA-directed RNA polymerase subunit RPC12/RpoP
MAEQGTQIECPRCGRDDVGTVEMITGVARFSLATDGSIAYEGYTDVDWDTSTTRRNRAGTPQVECTSCGHRWYAKVLALTKAD